MRGDVYAHQTGPPGRTGPLDLAGRDAEEAVTALYQAHALELVRIALVMVGDRQAAEDVVQDSYLALYRRWGRLRDSGKAVAYLRVSVLNGCRSALRRQRRRDRHDRHEGVLVLAESAESEVLGLEQRKEVLAALRRLPHRQRETLVLRYVFELSEEEIAEAMKVSRGTVKSNASRGRLALGRLLGEEL